MAIALWTVGHSNHEFEAFVDLLRPQQIEFVVDVRSYPYSRFAPHFNREDLQPALKSAGLGYLFMGDELGGRPARDDQYDDEGHARYDLMSREPAFEQAIERLIDGAANHRIAILCSCGRPDECHRRLLVGKVLADRGVELNHILPDGGLETEAVVDLADDPSQTSLFGNDEQPWRSTRSVSHRRRLSVSSNG